MMALNSTYLNIAAIVSGNAAQAVFASDSVETLPLEAIQDSNETVSENQTVIQTEQDISTEPASVSAEEATSAAETAAQKQYEVYEVQEGDSLISISRKFYNNTQMVDEIMTLNEITDEKRLIAGKDILLP
jgi:LysM repeat protein